MAVALEASDPAPRPTGRWSSPATGGTCATRCSRPSRSRRLHPERDFDICLCCSDERPPVPPGLAQLGVRYLPGDDRGRSSPGCGSTRGGREVAYLRLALPAAFAGGVPRGSSISTPTSSRRAATSAALLGVDLGGQAVGGGARQIAVADAGAAAGAVPALGLRAAPYFNAGLLLIDVGGLHRAGRSSSAASASGARTGR